MSPFLSPRAAEVAVEEPPMPLDDSTDGMRRMRHPFAVDPVAEPDLPATGDEGDPDGQERRSSRR